MANHFGRNPSEEFWKQSTSADMPADWAKEIDEFETELFLRKQNKIEEKVFAETRLRRGVYGQRYDNGKRHDGKEAKPIPYPCGDLTKGPMTVWDAPGMERIKIPWGGMTTRQMEVMADLAEEYSDSICHVTTRQDIQLHYIHIDDTPSIFRRLAAVGITTREACGNSVRNVTGCPLAGVCHTEAFDTTPYSDAMFRYLLGHPDVQDFGRKFKISFSGCKDQPCALANIHDLGVIAVKKTVDGVEKRGFQYYVGGGLGAVPQSAKLFDEFVSEEELFPITQAVCRIFARYGEKKNRNRARIKFLVSDWGIEKFKAAVLEERAKLPIDPRWTDFLKNLHQFDEQPLKPIQGTPEAPKEAAGDTNFERWLLANVRSQPQEGYCVVTVALPLGDITSNQMRDLAAIARQFIKESVRTTVEQNIVLRWVRKEDLYPLYKALQKIDLADATAGTIVDITACPGTDTCKLGISASRGLAGELRSHLAAKAVAKDEAIRNLKIKISGCFNSCGQHHISDIGFYGVSRKVGNYVVPHFQLVLGGQWHENGGAYGQAITTVPSKAIPKLIDRLADMYVNGREKGESFQAFIKRTGKVEVKKAITDLLVVPAYEQDPSYYVDWGDVREYTTSDIGKGECAGEIVSLVDFGLKAADRELFEAQVEFEKGDFKKAAQMGQGALYRAAQGLIKGSNPDISEDPNAIVGEFTTRFLDTKLFNDPFAGDKFGNFFIKAHKAGAPLNLDAEKARQYLDEVQLFIDAAYSCNVRMGMTAPASQPVM